MRYATIRVLAATLLCAFGACTSPSFPDDPPEVRSRGNPDITSELTIPRSEQFLLGGGQPDGFFTDIRNEGSVPVAVSSWLGDQRVEIGTVAPGARVSHTFSKRQTAVLRNDSPDTDAKLFVRIWTTEELEMRYTPAGK